GLSNQNRIGAGTSPDVQQMLLSGKLEVTYHRAAYTERPPVHRHHKGSRASRIIAEMQLRFFDRSTAPDELRQAVPCRVNISVVSDCGRQVARAPGNQKDLAVGSIPVFVPVLFQKL